MEKEYEIKKVYVGRLFSVIIGLFIILSFFTRKNNIERLIAQIRKLSVHIIIKRHWMNFVETIINISFFLLREEKFSI